MRRATDSALLALSFLTVLPVRLRAAAAHDLGSAAAWFPAVGALVGALAGGARAGLDGLLGAAAASVLAIAALIVVTGALHQDGLADCADGLGARGDRERRLAIMRDPSNGTFGTLALIGWVLVAIVAVASLESRDAVAALIAAASTGRWSVLLHAATTGPARNDGLGAAFDTATPAVLVATVVAVAIALLIEPWDAALALLAATAAMAALLTGWSRRSLGGRTGDTLGACVALSEVVGLLVVLGFQGPA